MNGSSWGKSKTISFPGNEVEKGLESFDVSGRSIYESIY